MCLIPKCAFPPKQAVYSSERVLFLTPLTLDRMTDIFADDIFKRIEKWMKQMNVNVRFPLAIESMNTLNKNMHYSNTNKSTVRTK